MCVVAGAHRRSERGRQQTQLSTHVFITIGGKGKQDYRWHGAARRDRGQKKGTSRANPAGHAIGGAPPGGIFRELAKSRSGDACLDALDGPDRL